MRKFHKTVIVLTILSMLLTACGMSDYERYLSQTEISASLGTGIPSAGDTPVPPQPPSGDPIVSPAEQAFVNKYNFIYTETGINDDLSVDRRDSM